MDDLETSEDGIFFLKQNLPHFVGDRLQLEGAIARRRQLLKGEYKEKYRERYLVALLLYVGLYTKPLSLDEIGNLYGVKKQRVKEILRTGLGLLRWNELWHQ